MMFPELPYENLEAPDIREFVRSDPRAFLNKHPHGCVIDEFQHWPVCCRFRIRNWLRCGPA